MAKITIVRPYEWNNQRKRINVHIDHGKVGHIGIDETVHFEVSAGKHTVTLMNPWPGHNNSLELDLSDDQNKTIKVSTSQRNFWIPFILVALTTFVYSLARSIFKVDASWVFEIAIIVYLLATIILVVAKAEILKLEEV